MRELYDALAAKTQQFVVLNYHGSDDRLESIRHRLASTGISTMVEETDSGDPANLGVFYDDETVLEAVDIDDWWPESLTVEHTLEGDGGFEMPTVPDDDTSVVVSPEITRQRLVGISRQFEQRALRAGTGRLSVGFQNLSVLADSPRTQRIYRQLATAGVDVSVHGYPDTQIGDVPYEIIPDETGTFRAYWFMLYDGGGDLSRKAVLVALEQENGYSGYWSTDSTVVDTVYDIARESYPELV